MADPRLLKSVGYGGMVPPSQDMNSGVGISAQPDLVQKISRMIFGNGNDLGFGPAALEAPIGMGAVLNAQNVAKMRDALSGAGALSSAEYAKRYVSLKYPKLFSLPSRIKILPKEDIGARYGEYLPGNNSVNLSGDSRISSKEMINTLTHEITHALQQKRGAGAGEYIMPSQGFQEYFNQPVEVGARQAGQTAASTFDKFINAILESYKTK